jgi:hypothetical protein
MEKDLLQEKIRAVSKNGRISCRQALKLSSEMDIPPEELGDLLNEIGIKISTCQLGCFP